MFSERFMTLLTSSTIIGGETGQQSAQAVTQAVSSTAQATPAQAGGIGIMGMVIYIVALIALFYFLAIRPQRKREKELQNLQNSIQNGDWVVTTSGFYGKVVDTSDQVFVIEFGTNKSVRIPVNKGDIVAKKEPNLM